MENNKGNARKGLLIAGVFALALIAILCSGAALLGNKASSTQHPTITVTTSTPRPTSAPPKQAAPKTIGGDDLVHVGEDVPAGTYRAVKSVQDGDLCYWVKSSDAEGEKILDNDIPTGGRPQVTLKSGQWFKSQGCPDWARK